MTKKINVLSLFDGMSCGRIALDNLGIDVTYHASEIDKYAQQISIKNYPDIIRLGDVNDRKDREINNIDMIIGGSPCQGFSMAGKGLNFDDPSKLFFTMVDIIKYYKPKYFLLENVKMKKEWQDVITEFLFGVEPIEINSSLVSAQNRKRLYRFGKLNEDGGYDRVSVEQPKDMGLKIKDILQDNVDKSFYMNANQIMGVWKSNYRDRQPMFVDDKCNTIKVGGDIKRIFATQLGNSLKWGNIGGGDKAYTLRASNVNGLFEDGYIRYLTPIECERLQTVPDDYTEGVSKTQRYKMLGNGWTVKVIEHLFKYL